MKSTSDLPFHQFTFLHSYIVYFFFFEARKMCSGSWSTSSSLSSSISSSSSSSTGSLEGIQGFRLEEVYGFRWAAGPISGRKANRLPSIARIEGKTDVSDVILDWLQVGRRQRCNTRLIWKYLDVFFPYHVIFPCTLDAACKCWSEYTHYTQSPIGTRSCQSMNDQRYQKAKRPKWKPHVRKLLTQMVETDLHRLHICKLGWRSRSLAQMKHWFLF